MTDFNIQTYLHDMDKRLTSGIDRVDRNVSSVRRELIPMDKRLVRNEAAIKWLSRFLVPTFVALAGWGLYGLGHALLAQAGQP